MPVRPNIGPLTPSDANLIGFASNVTGATWTLTTTATTDSLAHRVSIKNDTANDHIDKTALLTGTDADDKAQTETIAALPAGSATVESVKYFKTLTSIVPSATIGADTMDIGWVDEFVSHTLPYNWHGGTGGLYVNVTGTIDYTIQYTNSDVQNVATSTFAWIDSNDSNVVDATTDQASNWTYPVMATRVQVNSYSSGASIVLTIIQHDEV
jgi:hypothetical protein